MRKLATTLLLLALAPAATAAERAGVSAAVRGEVKRTASAAGEAVGIRFKGGESVFMGDGIASGSQSGMQLLLVDQTTFTIGPDSELTIDEFVYDPSANAGKVSASILKGGFRFVSGKIAANRPSDMVVKTPVATIGVRGTAVFGIVTPTETIIALAGPGRNNNTHDKVAGVDVFTPYGNTEIRRAGFAARIVPGQPPMLVRITGDLLRALEGALGPTGASGTSGPSRTPTEQGTGGIGQVTGIGALGGYDLGKTLETLEGIETTGTYLASSETSNPNSQVEQTQGEATDVQNVSIVAFDAGNLTTFQQLTQVITGYGFYTQYDVPLSGPGVSGSYDFDLFIDFGMQTMSGTFGNINVTGAMTVTNGQVPLSLNYAGFNFATPAGVGNSVTCGTGITCAGAVVFQNNGGNVAATATHVLAVTDNIGNAAVGSGTTPMSEYGF